MSDSTPPPSMRQQGFSPPLAPPADQSARPFGANSSNIQQSHFPASPPLSTSASHFDPATVPSPQVFTPSSAPMSAEHSLQGLSAMDTDETAMDTSEDVRSRKHRLEDEEQPTDSHKRRRTDHDRLEKPLQAVEQGLVQPAYRPLYKLCETAHPLSRPHVEQNLFSLYGLDRMAASVARKDPKTGEKINKLRKSYEGKVKELPGKNKAVSRPGELMNLINYPDEEWHVQQVSGKELSKGLTDNLLAKLDKAVQLQPAKLPDAENERWRNIIGSDDGMLKTFTQAPQKAEKPKPAEEAAVQYSTDPNDLTRPKRRGTKRRYHDDSFEGYGEGFDDDGGDGMSIDGDEDAAASKKKRRKVSTQAQSALATPASPSGSSRGQQRGTSRRTRRARGRRR